jgi:hypothetical protein
MSVPRADENTAHHHRQHQNPRPCAVLVHPAGERALYAARGCQDPVGREAFGALQTYLVERVIAHI